MTLPPLFWPWDYFDTCVGNTAAVDMCLRWTIERHAWQGTIILLLVVGLWFLLRNYGQEEA